MPFILKSLLLLLLSPLFLAAGSTPAPEDHTELVSALDSRIPALASEWNVPGIAVAIVKNGTVVFEKGFGFKDRERQLPVTPQTLFAIGSTTKAFTTFVMGTLCDEKKLDWDTPVVTYLPSFQLYDSAVSGRVTPRDLACHRTGVPRHDLLWVNSNLTRPQLAYRLRYLPNTDDLRAKWQYNNLMYAAAGYLIEEITHRTWEDAVRDRIFTPLGMSSSTFSVKDSSQDLACAYEKRDDAVLRVPYRDIQNIGPAGSINSCLADLIPWVMLHLNDGVYKGHRLIQSSTLKDIHAPHMLLSPSEISGVETLGYGLGWVIENYRGHRRVWHDGGIDGFTAAISLIPEENIGIIVLTNMGDTPLPYILTHEITDRILKLSFCDWNTEWAQRVKSAEKSLKEERHNKELLRKTGTTPSHPIHEYAGEYEHPGYGTVTIAQNNDALLMTYNGITTPLRHWHYDVFAAHAAPTGDQAHAQAKLLFQNDLAGDICAVEIPMEPTVANIIFTKKPSVDLCTPAYLRRFVGVYGSDTTPFTVTMDGETLLLKSDGEEAEECIPKTANTFTSKKPPSRTVKFAVDNRGIATEAQIETENGVVRAPRRQ